MQQDAHEFLNFLINHINEIIAGLIEIILKYSFLFFSTIFNLKFFYFNSGQHLAKHFYCYAKCHIFIVKPSVMLNVFILSLIRLGPNLTDYPCNDCFGCLNWNLYWFVLAEKTQATMKSKSTTPDLATSTMATETSTPTWINDIFQV